MGLENTSVPGRTSRRLSTSPICFSKLARHWAIL